APRAARRETGHAGDACGSARGRIARVSFGAIVGASLAPARERPTRVPVRLLAIRSSHTTRDP
ncbi:hypothetical protein, partial [Burkholderia glumae]|uniref:hypothetical protein n=1 Tax=Burkholderia glumae TaxID=337 RepID=UPI0019D6F67B